MSKRHPRPRPLPGSGSSEPSTSKSEGQEEPDKIRFEDIVSRIAGPAEKALAADAIIIWQNMESLTQGLRIAFHDLEKHRDARTMQRRYTAAILRFRDFVENTRTGDHIAASLQNLAVAISELEIGIVHPFLKPQKSSNRAPDSGFIWIERARLVYVYELFLASGLTHIEAFKRIRGYGNAFDPLLERSSHKGRADLKISLQSWRKKFKGGQVKSPIARSCYKRFMENVDKAKKLEMPSSEIDGFGRRLLEAVKAAVADLTSVRK